jgi:hypothetical protein
MTLNDMLSILKAHTPSTDNQQSSNNFSNSAFAPAASDFNLSASKNTSNTNTAKPTNTPINNGEGADKYKLSEQQRNERYYEGGKPSAKDQYGNSSNVKSDVVVADIVASVKDNWGSVDPKVRDMFENGEADKFFGNKLSPEFKSLAGWQKAAIFELSKSSFETAGTFDPDHKDPGDQAWGNFSLFNKNPGWKNYGLQDDLRSPKGKAALTSPGFGVIADLNTIPASLDLEQDKNTFGHDQALDRAHYTFVDVNKGLQEYHKQKSVVVNEAIGNSNQTKGIGSARNIMDFVLNM